MMELMFSQMGFWTVFTMLFMFAFLGYFVYKMVKLSKEAPTEGLVASNADSNSSKKE